MNTLDKLKEIQDGLWRYDWEHGYDIKYVIEDLLKVLIEREQNDQTRVR